MRSHFQQTRDPPFRVAPAIASFYRTAAVKSYGRRSMYVQGMRRSRPAQNRERRSGKSRMSQAFHVSQSDPCRNASIGRMTEEIQYIARTVYFGKSALDQRPAQRGCLNIGGVSTNRSTVA